MRDANIFAKTSRLKFVGRLSQVARFIVDEFIRMAWLVMLLFVGIRIGLEACRWFWLIYPETQLGVSYLGKHGLPAFGHLILSASLWSLTLVVISVPYLPTIAIVLVGRLLYLQRACLFLLGRLGCIGLWSGLSSVVSGKILAQDYEVSWRAGFSLTLVPCVVYTIYTFRLGTRICPEIGPCLRWLAYVTGLYDLWIRFPAFSPPTKMLPKRQERKRRRR